MLFRRRNENGLTTPTTIEGGFIYELKWEKFPILSLLAIWYLSSLRCMNTRRKHFRWIFEITFLAKCKFFKNLLFLLNFATRISQQDLQKSIIGWHSLLDLERLFDEKLDKKTNHTILNRRYVTMTKWMSIWHNKNVLDHPSRSYPTLWIVKIDDNGTSEWRVPSLQRTPDNSHNSQIYKAGSFTRLLLQPPIIFIWRQWWTERGRSTYKEQSIVVVVSPNKWTTLNRNVIYHRHILRIKANKLSRILNRSRELNHKKEPSLQEIKWPQLHFSNRPFFTLLQFVSPVLWFPSSRYKNTSSGNFSLYKSSCSPLISTTPGIVIWLNSTTKCSSLYP